MLSPCLGLMRHSRMWTMPVVHIFDLAQGYLQLPVAESDINKMTFRPGSSGLHEFTHMAFKWSNSGSSFHHLMEMCLGGQQFMTHLLHLEDICVFAASSDQMLD